VTSSDAIVKRLISGCTHDDEQAPSVVSVPLQDPTARAMVSHGPAAGAVDVTLSGRVGAVDRGNVYGLLARCVFYCASYSHFCCFSLDSRLFLIGYFFNESC
jgi:hypothetical protein